METKLISESLELIAETGSRTVERVIAAVRRVAAEEIMPRFLKVAHERKADGSLFTEADLAAQCIASRAQAEEMLRLIRQHAHDISLVMRLNAQYASMLRASLSAHGRLMRVQALRHKREAIEGAANEDAWALHIAERSMLGVVGPAAGSHRAAWPEPAGAAYGDHRIENHVS